MSHLRNQISNETRDSLHVAEEVRAAMTPLERLRCQAPHPSRDMLQMTDAYAVLDEEAYRLRQCT